MTTDTPTMTLAEMQVELQRFRDRIADVERIEAERRKRWRATAVVGIFSAILFSVIGVGFVLADQILDMAATAPSAHQYVQIVGQQMIISGIVMSLLAQAFAVTKRPS